MTYLALLLVPVAVWLIVGLIRGPRYVVFCNRGDYAVKACYTYAGANLWLKRHCPIKSWFYVEYVA